jgi:hypothetical protein
MGISQQTASGTGILGIRENNITKERHTTMDQQAAGMYQYLLVLHYMCPCEFHTYLPYTGRMIFFIGPRPYLFHGIQLIVTSGVAAVTLKMSIPLLELYCFFSVSIMKYLGRGEALALQLISKSLFRMAYPLFEYSTVFTGPNSRKIKSYVYCRLFV